MAPQRPDNCPVDSKFECPADAPKPVQVISDSSRKLHIDDMEAIEGHLGLVMSRIEDISKAALTPEHITEAVASGLIAALHDERTWAAAAAGIRTSAQREAGNILVSALSGVLKKVTLFSVAGLLVYWVGGWSALAAVWHAMFGGKP